MAELPITSGATERFSAFFTDGSGVPINLTGVTVTMESDGIAIANTVTVTSAAGGEVEVLITDAATALITKLERVRFKRVSSGGDVTLDDWFWLAPQ